MHAVGSRSTTVIALSLLALGFSALPGGYFVNLPYMGLSWGSPFPIADIYLDTPGVDALEGMVRIAVGLVGLDARSRRWYVCRPHVLEPAGVEITKAHAIHNFGTSRFSVICTRLSTSVDRVYYSFLHSSGLTLKGVLLRSGAEPATTPLVEQARWKSQGLGGLWHLYWRIGLSRREQGRFFPGIINRPSRTQCIGELEMRLARRLSEKISGKQQSI